MRINEIGGSHSQMHHMTTCIHDTKQLEDKSSGAAGPASNSSSLVAETASQAGEQFRLSGWLQSTFAATKKLLGKIWGSSGENLSGETADRAGQEKPADSRAQDMAGLQGAAIDWQGGLQNNLRQDSRNLQQERSAHTADSALHSSQIEAASAGVQPARNFNNNPYFTAVSEHTDSRQNLWQKIRVRFHNVTGFLAKRFSFGGSSSSFQTGQERPREDLRRHSRYREDELEIDCILTDDSYLLDSYNEKGEYSRLSGDTRGNMSVRK